eukprot:2259133-Pyramimonas_sp.AAC.2
MLRAGTNPVRREGISEKPNGIAALRIVLPPHVPTHHNTSQHITTHHNTSQHITTHHNISQRVTTQYKAQRHHML